VNLGRNVFHTQKGLQPTGQILGMMEQGHPIYTIRASDSSCTTLNISKGLESVVGILAVRLTDRESSATGSSTYAHGEEQLYGTARPEQSLQLVVCRVSC
jgi:hypothetical protein